MTTKALEIIGVSKSFKVGKKSLEVLENISFELQKGEIITIIGKSGLGKSTLLDIISGIEKNDIGSVNSFGNLGYMMQDDLILPWRTVYQNCLLLLDIKELNTNTKKLLAKRYLENLGLGDFLDFYPDEISGGMKQRLSIAKLLVYDPDIILMDEPFSALDFDNKLKTMQMIRYNFKIQNKSALLVMHNLDDAISISDKIIVLNGSPARVAYQKKVLVSAQYRDPIKIRKYGQYSSIFKQIWDKMSS